MERKFGGKFHLKLNIGSRPIANKYHEGKMKRTLKRELKVPEIAEREANGTSPAWRDCCMLRLCLLFQRKRLSWFYTGRVWWFLPCVSTSVQHWGKLFGHGSLPPGERTCVVELIAEPVHACLVAAHLCAFLAQVR